MHVIKLLHNLLDEACKSIDKRLRKTLFESAETLMHCKHLTVVSLGRSLKRSAKVKHKIKCIDRLFGNKALHAKKQLFYQRMAYILLCTNKRPAILIDWSGLTRCGAYHFLRASITVKGRALTLYEQTYPLREYSKDKTHRQFLNTLKNLLPKDIRPIIITDAGFRNKWFKAVVSIGWDFVGRVRNKTHYQGKASNKWEPIKELYQYATYKACLIGRVLLAKDNPLECNFYLMKQKKQYRTKRNLAGKKIQCSVSKKHEARENEPWLIASSLSLDEVSEKEIMILYKKRMQIEGAFRDLKNTRNGFSLRHCRSFTIERLNVALLIAALAIFVLWILGAAAKEKKLHYSFQTNTIKTRCVISNFMSGWQVLNENIIFTKEELMSALDITISLTHWRKI